MIKKITFYLVVIYVLVLLGFYFFQDSIIFRPRKTTTNHLYSFDFHFEELNLQMEDHAIINAVHFKVDNPKGVILYFHGNKGNLERWGKVVAPLTKHGYNVFVMDYRGYGKSTGKKTESLMYSDAQECYDYLKKEYKEKAIVIYGRSLGGVFASYVASKNLPRQLILEATFSSIKDVVESKFPILPYDMLLKFKFVTIELIEKVTVPTLIFHGNRDRLVPFTLGKKVAAHSNKSSTTFIEINKGTHHNLEQFKEYKKALELFLD